MLTALTDWPARDLAAMASDRLCESFPSACARDKRRRSMRENTRRLTARIIETNLRATNHLTLAAPLDYRAWSRPC